MKVARGRNWFGVVAVLLTMFANLASAKDWTLASQLPGIRKANAAEAKALNAEFGSSQIINYFEDGEFLIHDGDLVIDGHFDSDTRLVVRGNLTVKGFYNDYRDDIGVLLVTGNMAAAQLYSWGSLYVGKDLNVTGLALTVYNDFTFEVGGKVNARALVVSDKSNDYTAGRIETELNDMDGIDDADTESALRIFVPELFTQPDHFEPEFDDDFYGLDFDDSYALQLMSEGSSVFRDTIAAKGLNAQVNRSMKTDLSEPDQLSLLAKDRLLAQLLASHSDLSDRVAKALAQLQDPTVNAWLANSKPELVLAQTGEEVSPALAQSLAVNPSTSLASLAKLAQHPDARVRMALAKFSALPDTEAGRMLMDGLVRDRDSGVRAEILEAFAYASAFGWNLSDAVIKERIGSDAQAELNGLASAHLNAAQANALLAKLDVKGAFVLAQSLRQQAEQARPTRMSRAEMAALAEKILARPLAKNESSQAHTAAFLALPAELQSRHLDALIARQVLDLGQVMRESNSQTLLQQLANWSIKAGNMISKELADNPYLPEALQLQIVQLARAAPAKKDDDYSEHPVDALEDLLYNDAIRASAIEQAVDMALEQGLNPEDGSYQNALFHANTLSAKAISQLEAKLDGSEDWALTLMGQSAATVSQRVRALKRWYNDDMELQDSLKGSENATLEQFYQRAATSASKSLQEYALAKPDLARALVESLQKSEHSEVVSLAKRHPQLALSELDPGLLADIKQSDYLIRIDSKDWLKISQISPSFIVRAMAHLRYGQLQLKAVP